MTPFLYYFISLLWAWGSKEGLWYPPITSNRILRCTRYLLNLLPGRSAYKGLAYRRVYLRMRSRSRRGAGGDGVGVLLVHVQRPKGHQDTQLSEPNSEEVLTKFMNFPNDIFRRKYTEARCAITSFLSLTCVHDSCRFLARGVWLFLKVSARRGATHATLRHYKLDIKQLLLLGSQDHLSFL